MEIELILMGVALIGAVWWLFPAPRDEGMEGITVHGSVDHFIEQFKQVEDLLAETAKCSGVALQRLGGMYNSPVPVNSWTLAVELQRKGRISNASYMGFMDLRRIHVDLMSGDRGKVVKRESSRARELLQMLMVENRDAQLQPVYAPQPLIA